MKSFLAIPALFALGAVAETYSPWSFTWTFTSGHHTYTSATYATNATTTTASTTTGPWTESVSATSYTAAWSSGTSTWGIPTDVSYTVASNFTHMITAHGASSTYVSKSGVTATTPAPITSVVPASYTSSHVATFTGAAPPNLNGKMAGMGAVAVAGLALVF